MWGDPVDEVHILVLPRERYPVAGPLPAGFSFVDDIPRSVERELLRSEFEHWRIPYERAFPGVRADSLLGIATGGQIVAIGYLGAENELGLPNYGQAHYPVIRNEFRRKGLTGPRFAKLLDQASTWGLAGVVLALTREGLPELYERWGALPVGRLEPPRGASRILNRFVDPHCVLARRATEILREHGAGM